MSFTAEVKGVGEIDLNVQAKKGALIAPELLEELGECAVKMIRERTAKGIDTEDRPFQPYSGSWKKARRKRGKASAPVDLNFEGDMLAGMKVSVNAGANEVVVNFFGNGEQAEKARFHNVSGAGSSKVRRMFLGLTQGEVNLLEELLKSRVTKIVASG